MSVSAVQCVLLLYVAPFKVSHGGGGGGGIHHPFVVLCVCNSGSGRHWRPTDRMRNVCAAAAAAAAHPNPPRVLPRSRSTSRGSLLPRHTGRAIDRGCYFQSSLCKNGVPLDRTREMCLFLLCLKLQDLTHYSIVEGFEVSKRGENNLNLWNRKIPLVVSHAPSCSAFEYKLSEHPAHPPPLAVCQSGIAAIFRRDDVARGY